MTVKAAQLQLHKHMPFALCMRNTILLTTKNEKDIEQPNSNSLESFYLLIEPHYQVGVECMAHF